MINPAAQSRPHPAFAPALRATVILATVIGLVLTPAAARTSAFKHGPTTLLAQQNDIGPGAAATAASSTTGGRVLGVRRQSSANGILYLVKVLLPGGHVRNVIVDGRTGRVSG